MPPRTVFAVCGPRAAHRNVEERGLHAGFLSNTRRRAFKEGLLVNVRLISSMTDEDEGRFASVLIAALDHLLSRMPASYHVRIETADGLVLERSRTAADVGQAVITPRDLPAPLLPDAPSAT